LTAFETLRRGAVGLALGATLMAGLPGRAGAEPAPPPSKEAAQRHLERGNQLFRHDDIPAALAEFQAAFDLFPSPKLHFNLGQCERALERPEAAARHFERFLAEAGDVSPELRAEAQRYLDEARAASAPPAPPPAVAPAAARAEAPVLAAPAPVEARPLYRRWWFWTAVGAAVVGGTVAAIALTRPRDPSCDNPRYCF
jgi:tetratricopeptide (TPR) repeat protein